MATEPKFSDDERAALVKRSHGKSLLDEILSLESQLREARADRQALIDGKVWDVYHIENHEVIGWRHAMSIKDGPSPLFATADAALAAFRASQDGGSRDA